MPDEIELINDGEGIALFGDPAVIDAFLESNSLQSREVRVSRLSKNLSAASGAAQAGAEIVANSGRWVKLTKESAQALKVGTAMKGSSPLVSRAIVMKGGKTSTIVEFVKPGASMLTNPAVLTGAAGLMAQLAMQQAMDEITDYLAVIDQKVEDVLRAQKDAILADMIGAGWVVDDAMQIREGTGRVSEVTWSKVQTTSSTIASTQAYALRQLDALAAKLEKQTAVGDIAKVSKDAEEHVQEWLAVLARCVQLQDAVSILELDRVLDSAPADLEGHRVALRKARQQRLHLIVSSTERLVERIAVAAGIANAKVLLHPRAAMAIVGSSNRVVTDVVELHDRLGIESGTQFVESRKWIDAAVDMRDKAVETGAAGLGAAKSLGVDAAGQIRARTSRLAFGVTERLPSKRANPPESDTE